MKIFEWTKGHIWLTDMFVFLELALTKDEVQPFHCMEKVAENQRSSMTCSGLWVMWKADLVSKPSFSDAKVCSFILFLKFLVVKFWVSSEGARECIWFIFISLIYTFLKIISCFLPILSEFVAIFWTLGVFGSTFEGQHLFKGKKGEHWKKFSIVFTLFICWLFQHQVLNLLTGWATLLYIRKGKGLVSGIECGVPFSGWLDNYALSVSFHWQELVPDPRMHTVTHSAQDFTWRTLPVCILITAKIQFTHRSNFDGIPGRFRSSPGSQAQRGMRQMQEFAIRKALRILTPFLSASASPKSFPGDHHTTPQRICPALSPDPSREYSPGLVLALLTSLANSVGFGMNLFFPCLNRYHQPVLLGPQGINKGPKEKTPRYLSCFGILFSCTMSCLIPSHFPWCYWLFLDLRVVCKSL